MVDVERTENKLSSRFILRPNRSMSWRGSLLFYSSLCVLSTLTALALSALGFWMILPFAGLEMLILGVVLYTVACRCYECEVISIAEDSILIERGRNYPQQRWALNRNWARVILTRCPRQWYPSRLLIRSHGRAIEVGQFLPEGERELLASELTRSL